MLFLHDHAIREYGGLQGVKDDGLLDSALGRPVNRSAYAESGTIDLFDLAAAYAFGLARNHAFHDGNKRTAWACCVLFLNANGVSVKSPVVAVIDEIIRLVGSSGDEDRFAAWLRTNAGKG